MANLNTVAKVERVEAGVWEVVDVRLNRVVKRNLKTGMQARAYAEYYTEEVSKAEKQWKI